MTAMLAFPAMASEKIEEVTIDINAVLTDSDNLEVEAEVSDDGCYVDEVSSHKCSRAETGMMSTKPKVKSYYWRGERTIRSRPDSSKSDVYLGNDEQTVTSVTRSTSKLYVYVTLQQISDIDTEYDDEDYDLDVYDLSWDDSYGGVAYWEGTEYAKKYQVRLYRDGRQQWVPHTRRQTTIIISADHSQKKAVIHLKSRQSAEVMRAAGKSLTPKDVDRGGAVRDLREPEQRQSDVLWKRYFRFGEPDKRKYDRFSADGAWLRDSNGWWWCNPDKTYPVANWKQINNVWYYFNQSGYMVENQWILNNNQWYYCGCPVARW